MGDSLSYLDLLLQVCRRGKKMFCDCDRFRLGYLWSFNPRTYKWEGGGGGGGGEGVDTASR